MKFGLFGKMTAVANKRDELIDILVEAAHMLNTNHDCLHYVIGKSEEDENSIWIWELWTTKEAHDKSLEPQEVKDIIMKARPLIAEIAQGVNLNIVGGKE